ncbi:hypothetical protein DRW03_21305 [Corallococcus sp. H22C18031201]|nr:hypothetical protein DRW03_21305 [Corallococcus sp. H22C18031201]
MTNPNTAVEVKSQSHSNQAEGESPSKSPHVGQLRVSVEVEASAAEARLDAVIAKAEHAGRALVTLESIASVIEAAASLVHVLRMNSDDGETYGGEARKVSASALRLLARAEQLAGVTPSAQE